ncbi:pseudouridine synthase [Myceligenerans xiligouense]|uniref:RNA pseudouridylate synthase n=1 Tax=Myceligenerans xiligouense TaxID=253184 RepID=A0A3N4YQD2_9MICO|nr:pseudouridine synthase [Myceligenerans xiligouense]RPF22823.1 tRNA pseudouridine32 synthase/23S rRNA pseudouridine746 synthase [Myceligenerans xiligouense]
MLSPLPVRDGLNPTRLVLPHDDATVARCPTSYAWLLDRFPDDRTRLREKVAAGEVVTGRGTPITPDTPYEPRGLLFLYRDPPRDEPAVPFEPEILHHDADLLVVDKPHFLATMPRGRWIRNTVLVRLRATLDLPELSPAHRLDRPTAGVLVLTVRREVRGAYQTLFQERRVRKVYEAVAPLHDDLSVATPVTVRSRIVKHRGTAPAQEVPGAPNAESRITLVARDEARGLGLYRLEPHTGKTHQLRLHMASLGVPILHDPFWPVLREDVADDFARPLQLLARAVEFRDPLDGALRRFESRRSLDIDGALPSGTAERQVVLR